MFIFSFILLLFLGCNDNSTSPDDSFYIKNINILSDGISSTSNIYIEFSNPIDTDSFDILNETVLDADGDTIQLDFSYALMQLGQESNYISLNDTLHNLWYDNRTNTIAIISNNSSEDSNEGLLFEEENTLFISKYIVDKDGNILGNNEEYSINKDSQIGLTIISNPTDVQSVISLGGEGDGLQFHMSGVPEEYSINIYDINDTLISSQDNNHINAELSTYAEWGGMISDDEISPGIYRLQLLSNNILKMRSIIVVSH